MSQENSASKTDIQTIARLLHEIQPEAAQHEAKLWQASESTRLIRDLARTTEEYLRAAPQSAFTSDQIKIGLETWNLCRDTLKKDSDSIANMGKDIAASGVVNTTLNTIVTSRSLPVSGSGGINYVRISKARDQVYRVVEHLEITEDVRREMLRLRLDRGHPGATPL